MSTIDLTTSTNQTPRVSDTGSQTPQADAHVDYASITWTGPDAERLAKHYAYATGYEWHDCPHGAMGYNRMQIAHHAAVFTDAPLVEMGTHLQLRGEGCQDLEAQDGWEGWQCWVSDVLQSGGRFSRIDVAFDDTTGMLDLAVIEQHMKERSYTSRWRITQRHYERRQGETREGITLNWGAGGSRLSLRIYDYATKHNTGESHHIRVELQCRDEAAQAVARLLAQEGFVAVARVIASRLQFRVAESATRIERATICDWWLQFIGACERAITLVRKAAPTIESTIRWIERAAGRALAITRLALGSNSWADWLRETAIRNERYLEPRHWALLPTPSTG